jgi:hypothetical protein
MKILILVHVEETFRRNGYLKDDTIWAIVDGINKGDFDRVIHMTSGIEDYKPIDDIAHMVDEEIEWGWGYEQDHFVEKEEADWIIESWGHEKTWVPPEFRNGGSANTEVFLGGGYDGECLADFQAVLEHVGIPYTLVREMVY